MLIKLLSGGFTLFPYFLQSLWKLFITWFLFVCCCISVYSVHLAQLPQCCLWQWWKERLKLFWQGNIHIDSKLKIDATLYRNTLLLCGLGWDLPYSSSGLGMVTQAWPIRAGLGTFAGMIGEEGFSLLRLLALEIRMVISAIT